MVAGVELENDHLVFRARTEFGQLLEETALSSQRARLRRLLRPDVNIEPDLAAALARQVEDLLVSGQGRDGAAAEVERVPDDLTVEQIANHRDDVPGFGPRWLRPSA